MTWIRSWKRMFLVGDSAVDGALMLEPIVNSR
ncbi:hypothetical protein ABIE66_001031 [Peribacillus sp. B2I2]